MVRTVVVASFLLLLAVPALAQDDYPRIELAMGYANLGFPSFDFNNFGETTRHSGFATHMGFNLTRTFGIENYTGIYGLGKLQGAGVTLISNIVSGKVMYRASRIVPYAVAGIGVGYFSTDFGSDTGFSVRYGGGADIPFSDSFGFKVDVSRLGTHGDLPRIFGNSWSTNWNISTGIVFTLSN
jgi:opacity protein-like surface antigen